MKSIKTKYFIEKCLFGFNFIACGVFYYSIIHSWYLWWLDLILGAIIIVNFVFQCLFIPTQHFEPVDEMTKQHEWRAQAATYSGFCLLITVLGLLCVVSKNIRNLVFSIHINWIYLFIILGILQIIEFVCFICIERRDDLIE